MKIIMTILALTTSLSAFAEKPKDAAGCTQEQIQNRTCYPTRSQMNMQEIAVQQKRYFDLLASKNLKHDDLTAAEKAKYAKEAANSK